jgi:hypothetical protein
MSHESDGFRAKVTGLTGYCQKKVQRVRIGSFEGNPSHPSQPVTFGKPEGIL